MMNSALIYVAGVLGVWKGVSLGLAIQEPPVITCIMTILGAATSTTVLCWAGGLVRERFMKKLPARFIVKKEKRARRLFERYGPAGLGLIGTLLIGPLITILIGSTLLDTRTRVLVWTMAGIILWSAVLTAAGATGIATVSSLLNR